MTVTEKLIYKTYEASFKLQRVPDTVIKKTLVQLAGEIEKSIPQLIKANKKDLLQQDKDNPKNDRLMLNEERIRSIAKSIIQISKLPNPAGKIIEKRILYNGLQLQKMSVPLGVVGAIYESRPNVTFDIAALCFRSMNACILKGSRDAENSNKAAIAVIKKVLKKNHIDPDCITLLPAERDAVPYLLRAEKYVDVIIPRGSNELIQYTRKNSLVPVIETGAGVCHVYVEQDADIRKAIAIVVNAKVSRPSVCNSLDSLLIDEPAAEKFLHQLLPEFEKYKVEIFADAKAYKLLKNYPYKQKAKPADFGREFLSLKCAVKIVKNYNEAIEHIRQYSTRHSEAIVSKNKTLCERFLKEVDAATVYSNASTRFTDGAEFGLGAEIGISTQKLHARGPFALEKLITEKWVIRGHGQIRD
ncbi:MAG: glutamate-5-semialdehyde dehydrogenase [Chitinophagaceae bacterium]|nr:glutamate-5-semialdehyde dehydrogenase [Chitinophagaceae bacterium]